MIEAIKVTQETKTRDLTGLVVGDNLDIEGRRAIVGRSETNKYFQAIRLLTKNNPDWDLIYYQDYFATPNMLADGVLQECCFTPGVGAVDPGNGATVNSDYVEFYKQHLIEQTVEAIA